MAKSDEQANAERLATIRRLEDMNAAAERHLAALRAQRPGVVASGKVTRLRQLDASIAEFQAEIHQRNGRISKLSGR